MFGSATGSRNIRKNGVPYTANAVLTELESHAVRRATGITRLNHFGVHMSITRLLTGTVAPAVVAAAALSLHLSAQQTPAPVERGKRNAVPGPVPRTADGRP